MKKPGRPGKTQVRSGHGTAPGGKVSGPAKPAATKVKTGFQPLSGLNTSGSRQAIPHDSRGGSSTNVGYQYKLNLAGVGKRGKKMY